MTDKFTPSPNEIKQEISLRLGGEELHEVLERSSEPISRLMPRIKRLGEKYNSLSLTNRTLHSFLRDEESPIGGLLVAARELEKRRIDAKKRLEHLQKIDVKDRRAAEMLSGIIPAMSILDDDQQLAVLKRVARTKFSHGKADMIWQAARHAYSFKADAAKSLIGIGHVEYAKLPDDDHENRRKISDAVAETFIHAHNNKLMEFFDTESNERLHTDVVAAIPRYYERNAVASQSRLVPGPYLWPSTSTPDESCIALSPTRNLSVEPDASIEAVELPPSQPRRLDLLSKTSRLRTRLETYGR